MGIDQSYLATAKALLSAINADLILHHIHLPDGNGLDLLNELRREEMKSEVMLSIEKSRNTGKSHATWCL